MRWRQSPSHKLITAIDAVRLTGLSPEALLGERDVQTLLRVHANGTSERMLRVPIVLLLESKEEQPEELPQAKG
jgi:hypothetical protein